MNKKFTILIILILLIITGGVFWWWESRKEKEDKGEIVEYHLNYPLSKEEDFAIEDTPEGKIVKNEKEGLFIEVPEGWNARKTNLGGENGWIVELLSPDVKFRSDYTFLPEEGCGIEISIKHDKDEYEIKKNYIRAFQEYPELLKEAPVEEEIELLEVSGHPALKEVFFENEELGKSIMVTVPMNEKLYIFGTLLVPKDKERCFQEFNNFLKKVSIE